MQAVYWYVCGGVRSGHGKGGESCRWKKGKRIVEERRGRISEGSYPCRRKVCGKNIRLESMFHLGGGEP